MVPSRTCRQVLWQGMPSELQKMQLAFTAHLRDPAARPVPEGMDPARMQVYSELIFNNVSAILAELFPVICSLLDEDSWQRLIRDFFVAHTAATPYFPKLAEEFVGYLANRQMTVADPGFLLPLAHYEWMELELYTAPDPPAMEAVQDSDLARVPLMLSPLARPLAYAWPVHRIGPDFQPQKPDSQPSCLLVLRDAEDDVRFFEIQPLAFELLTALQEKPGLLAEAWLSGRARELGIQDRDRFVGQGIGMLQQLNENRIFFPFSGGLGSCTAVG